MFLPSVERPPHSLIESFFFPLGPYFFLFFWRQESTGCPCFPSACYFGPDLASIHHFPPGPYSFLAFWWQEPTGRPSCFPSACFFCLDLTPILHLSQFHFHLGAPALWESFFAVLAYLWPRFPYFLRICHRAGGVLLRFLNKIIK